jgi:hypothetical protein
MEGMKLLNGGHSRRGKGMEAIGGEGLGQQLNQPPRIEGEEKAEDGLKEKEEEKQENRGGDNDKGNVQVEPEEKQPGAVEA